MSQIAGVIFDCDGVMFESRQANLAYYNRIFAEFNYPPVLLEQQQQAHLCHTASSPNVLAALLSVADLEPALNYAATLDYREFIPFMQPEPHLHEVLEKLFSQYPLAIATNRGSSITPILAHFGLEQFFSVVVTSRDVVQPKPAPDMLLLAAGRMKLRPEQCLFIGDSELDQQAACDARVRFLGYGSLLTEAVRIENHLQLLDYLLVV